MGRSTRIGVDIGATGVRAAELSMRSVPPTLVRVGQVPLSPGAVSNGEIRDPGAVSEALRELWRRGRFRSKEVILGVANQRVVVREVLVPWLEDKELRASLPYQVQEYVPISLEEAVLDFHVLEEFEREGVPGLGWRIDASDVVPAEVPVAVRDGADGEFFADGVRLLFLDEPDVGDLYNYCYADEGQVPWAPAENRISGQTVTAWFDEKLEVEVRVSRREGESFLRLDGVSRNARPDHRLRLHIALDRQVDGALAGSPFELVRRPSWGKEAMPRFRRRPGRHGTW